MTAAAPPPSRYPRPGLLRVATPSGPRDIAVTIIGETGPSFYVLLRSARMIGGAWRTPAEALRVAKPLARPADDGD